MAIVIEIGDADSDGSARDADEKAAAFAVRCNCLLYGSCGGSRLEIVRGYLLLWIGIGLILFFGEGSCNGVRRRAGACSRRSKSEPSPSGEGGLSIYAQVG